MKNKIFDCVKMTRDIRDKLYEKKKDKSFKEFTRILCKEARKSTLWKNLKIVNQAKEIIL